MLSSRITAPLSIFAALALASSTRLICSQVSARTALIVLCSTDTSSDTSPPAASRRHGTRRVLEVKRQLLVAQLAVLLQQTRAQHRLGRKPVASGLLDPVTTQVGGDQARQLTMLVEPPHRPQLAADLVQREDIEYTGLDDAFLAHWLRRSKVCFGFIDMIPNAYLKPPGFIRANDRFIQLFQRLAVCGRALASRPESSIAVMSALVARRQDPNRLSPDHRPCSQRPPDRRTHRALRRPLGRSRQRPECGPSAFGPFPAALAPPRRFSAIQAPIVLQNGTSSEMPGFVAVMAKERGGPAAWAPTARRPPTTQGSSEVIR